MCLQREIRHVVVEITRLRLIVVRSVISRTFVIALFILHTYLVYRAESYLLIDFVKTSNFPKLIPKFEQYWLANIKTNFTIIQWKCLGNWFKEIIFFTKSIDRWFYPYTTIWHSFRWRQRLIWLSYHYYILNNSNMVSSKGTLCLPRRFTDLSFNLPLVSLTKQH